MARGGIREWQLQGSKNAQKLITVHESALWREESEGRRGGSLSSLPPTIVHVRTTGPSGETLVRKESFVPTE